jgi:hypothetical protein
VEFVFEPRTFLLQLFDDSFNQRFCHKRF